MESTKPEEVEFYFPQKTALDVALGSKVSILSGNIVRWMCPVVNDDTEVTITWYVIRITVMLFVLQLL